LPPCLAERMVQGTPTERWRRCRGLDAIRP
jgi:hypothetical protein